MYRFLEFNDKKIKHPIDISQNLVGIEQYVKDIFCVQKKMKVMREIIDRKKINKKNILKPFLVFFEIPETQNINGKKR